ncbi:MAG: hypothetical protein ACON3Z_13500 [Bradymonadia bacterium]
MPWFIAILIMLIASSASASPTVVVSSQTSFRNIHQKHTGQGWSIRGQLVDDLNQPIVGGKIVVGWDAVQWVTYTSRTGAFMLTLPKGPEVTRVVELRYPGGDVLAGQRASVAALSPHENHDGKTQNTSKDLELFAKHQDTIEFGQPLAVHIVLKNASRAPVVGVELNISLNQRRVSSCTTSTHGECRLSFTDMPIGEQNLSVQVQSGQGISGRHESTIQVHGKIRATLEARLRAFEGQKRAEFMVRLKQPFPISSAVTLIGAGRAIETRVAEQGVVRFSLPSAQLPRSRTSFHALLRTEIDGWRNGTTNPISLTVGPLGGYEQAVIYCLLGLLLPIGIFAVRRVKQVPPPKAKSATYVMPKQVEFNPTNLSTAKLELSVQRGQSSDPVPCTIWVNPPPSIRPSELQQATGQVDSLRCDGRHEFAVLPRAICITAPGYASQQITLDGQTGRVKVSMWTVRASAQLQFMAILQAHGLPLIRFGPETVREATSTLQQRGLSDSFAHTLVNLTETLCFAEDDPSETLLETYRSLSQQIMDQDPNT